MEKVFFYNQYKEKLVGFLHKPKKKTDKGIIFVHGFTGNKDRNFIPKLSKELSKKYNVLRFDFSGNGESEGKFEDQCYSKYVEELKKAIDFMKKKENKKICLIAHSLGTNISVLEEEKYKNINKLILIAPAIYVKVRKISKFPLLQYFITLFKGNVEFTDSWNEKRKLKKKFFWERIIYQIPGYLKNVKKPILMILAEKDKVIKLDDSMKLCKKYNIKCKVVKNSGHNFYKKEFYDKMKNETLKFLEKF